MHFCTFWPVDAWRDLPKKFGHGSPFYMRHTMDEDWRYRKGFHRTPAGKSAPD